jgi:hypothetical protein
VPENPRVGSSILSLGTQFFQCKQGLTSFSGVSPVLLFGRRVGFCVGFFPRTFKNFNRFTFQIANAVQIDFGCFSVLMPKYPLYRLQAERYGRP